jgi:hypothetical protein
MSSWYENTGWKEGAKAAEKYAFTTRALWDAMNRPCPMADYMRREMKENSGQDEETFRSLF